MKNRFYFSLLTVYMFILVVFIIIKPGFSSIYNNYYNTLLIVYTITGGVTILLAYFNKTNIFEPVFLVAIIYIMMFSITPMLDLIEEKIDFLGVSLWQGCYKASTYFVIGYLFFLVGYYLARQKKYEIAVEYSEKHIIKISILMWCISYIFSMIYILSSGKSFIYILTFGVSGTISGSDESGLTGFLSMFSYSLIPTWLMLYSIKSYSRINVFIMALLTVNIYLVRGFRFIILIFIMAIFLYNHIHKKKFPKLKNMIIILIILSLMIGVVGYTRNSIRSGVEISWNDFSSDTITQSILGNFRIYQPFYGMVENIPLNYDYTLGRQMAYTITMFIPRVIWPNKPTTPAKEVLRYSVNEYSVMAGSAFPNIGEYYSEFGLYGIIIFMFLLGIICKLAYKSINPKDKLTIMRYSIFLPALFQVIIRGYTPANFYLLVFLLAPLQLMQLTKARVKIKEINYYKEG